MIYALVVIHILVAIALVVSILLQSGRGGGLAGAFGGSMGGASVFGGRGAGDFLAKVTGGLAIAFVVLTVGINLLSSAPSARPSSVIPQEAGKEMPAQPGGVPGQGGGVPGQGGGMPQTPPPGGGEAPPGGGQ